MNPQYRIIERGAGLVDCRLRGRLRLTGHDAASFLHALVSNDITGLRPGRGCHVTYLTPQGRMLADFDVLCRPDGLFCNCSPGQLPALATRLDQLIFAEDVQVADVSAGWAEWTVVGREAPAVVARAFGLDETTVRGLDDLAQTDLTDGFVCRTTDVAVPMFRVFVPAARHDEVGRALEDAGAGAVDADLVEALRIAHGRPRWGADLDGDVIPLEAGLLERGISTTKGCYVGQEIVIRILHRGGGRVARRLVRLAFDPAMVEVPKVGRPFVADDGTHVGRLTSACASPDADGFIGLGYVARELAEAGAIVRLDDGAAATVTGLAG